MAKSPIELRQTWEERIQKQKASGLTIQHWCRDNQIPLHLFYNWKRRLFPKTLSRGCFIEIAEAKDVGITIEMKGISVRLEKHFDAATLKRCLETLRSC